MGTDSVLMALGLSIQVFFLDLILSGDNALVIALACRNVAAPLRARAVLIGTGVAVILRTLLTTVVGYVLMIPLLKLVGAVLLLVIAIKLLLDSDDNAADKGGEDASSTQTSLASAVVTVVVADLVLSLDNVVALGAVAQGSVWLLVLGLLGSVPLLMYGSLFIGRWLDKNPWLVPGGSMLLGWIAGRIAVSDPLVADWVNSQAPALKLVVPAICVIFVLLESRIIRQQSRVLVRPAPLRNREPVTANILPTGPALIAAAPVSAPAISPKAVVAVAAAVPTQTPLAEDQARSAQELATTQPTTEPELLDPPALIRPDDPVNVSPLWSIGLKVLFVLAGIIGVICLGWLFYHLFIVGTMPPPSGHPVVTGALAALARLG